MKHLALVWLFGAVLAGCHPASLPPVAYQQYIDDPTHGFQQQQQVGEVRIRAIYQPPDYLVAREVVEQHFAGRTLDSLRRQYGGTAYFLLAFSRNGRGVLQPGEGFSQYSSLLQTLAFQAGSFARLITSQGDTLRPVNYYLDRTTPGIASTQLLIAFRQPALAGTWKLHLQECGLGIGPLTFDFATNQFRNAPALQL